MGCKDNNKSKIGKTKQKKIKFNAKFDCTLCNLKEIRIDKEDKTKSLKRKAKDKTYALITKNTLL